MASDTALLNWMIAHGAYVSHSRDGESCNTWFSQDPEDDGIGAVPVEGYPQKCYPNAREAIEAAMQWMQAIRGSESPKTRLAGGRQEHLRSL